MDELTCIKCSKPLEAAFAGSSTVNQPYQGTVFVTHGQYGSTVFDEGDGTYLEITVCDSCLREAGRAGQVYHAEPRRVPMPDPIMKKWKYWEDEREIES